MNRKRFLPAIALLLAGAYSTLGCRGTPEQDYINLGGGRVESSSGLSLSSGGLSIHGNQVGIVFGPTLAPSDISGPRYMLLLKRKSGGMKLSGVTARTGSQSQSAYSDLDLTLNGVTISTRYHAALKEPGQNTMQETLTFNGKPVNLAEGNVFLVDVQGALPIWKQTMVSLPTLPKQSDNADIDVLAKQSVEQLAQQSLLVRDFLH